MFDRTIPPTDMVAPGAHYELCRVAIMDMLLMARHLGPSEEGLWHLTTARWIQRDCNMSNIDYDEILEEVRRVDIG